MPNALSRFKLSAVVAYLEELRGHVSHLCHASRSFGQSHHKALLATGVVIGSYVAVKLVGFLWRVYARLRARAYFRTLEPGVVHLFIYRRWPHGPNFYPACVKVETFLRIAKIAYVAHFVQDAHLSPNGRLPFVVTDGLPLTGCDFIIQYLTTRFDIKLDAQLTPQEHSAGRLVQRMLETRFNNGLIRTLFLEVPERAKKLLEESGTSALGCVFILRDLRRTVLKDLALSGYHQLAHDKHEAEFLDAVQSLDVCLRKSPFLFGSKPTTFDCTAYAWLQVAREVGPHGPALSFLVASDPIQRYIDRMSQTAFPDIKALQTEGKMQRFVPSSKGKGSQEANL